MAATSARLAAAASTLLRSSTSSRTSRSSRSWLHASAHHLSQTCVQTLFRHIPATRRAASPLAHRLQLRSRVWRSTRSNHSVVATKQLPCLREDEAVSCARQDSVQLEARTSSRPMPRDAPVTSTVSRCCCAAAILSRLVRDGRQAAKMAAVRGCLLLALWAALGAGPGHAWVFRYENLEASARVCVSARLGRSLAASTRDARTPSAQTRRLAHSCARCGSPACACARPPELRRWAPPVWIAACPCSARRRRWARTRPSSR